MLAEARVPFSEVTAQRATLEDVYLQLTSGESRVPGRRRRRRDDRHDRQRNRSGRRQGFAPVLRAEWTKFRTVRGWLIGLLVAAGLCVAFTFLVANGSHEGGCTGPPPPVPARTRPDPTATPVTPSSRPARTAKPSPTATTSSTSRSPATAPSPPGSARSPASSRPTRRTSRPRSRTPGPAWRRGRRPGSCSPRAPRRARAYAAVMATGGHGDPLPVRLHPRQRRPARRRSPATSPRWLRLTRSGDTLTGYDSTDGTSWTRIGTTRLAGLPATVHVGLFVTSPVSFQGSSSGVPTRATATFDHVTHRTAAPTPSGWHGHSIGTGPQDFYPTLGAGSYHRSGNAVRRQRLRRHRPRRRRRPGSAPTPPRQHAPARARSSR